MKKIRNITALLCSFFLLIVLVSCKKKQNNNQNPTDDTDQAANSIYQYGADSRQHFELILPDNYNANTPIVLYIHGGAWVLGPKESDKVNLTSNTALAKLANKLVDNGIAIAVMKYRLACYVTQPENLNANSSYYIDNMMQDINLCISKLQEVSQVKGIASNRIALLGESAGAHLALMNAFNSNSNTAIKTVISFFAPTDFTDNVFLNNANISIPVLSSSNIVVRNTQQCLYQTNQQVNLLWGLRSFIGFNIPTSNVDSSMVASINLMRSANITRQIPTFLMHGQNDLLVPYNHSLKLYNKLQSQTQLSVCNNDLDFQGQLKYKTYPICGHGWANNGCNQTLIFNDVVQWLNTHL